MSAANVAAFAIVGLAGGAALGYLAGRTKTASTPLVTPGHRYAVTLTTNDPTSFNAIPIGPVPASTLQTIQSEMDSVLGPGALKMVSITHTDAAHILVIFDVLTAAAAPALTITAGGYAFTGAQGSLSVRDMGVSP